MLSGPTENLDIVYGRKIPCFCWETNQLQAQSLYEIHIPFPLNTEGRDQNLFILWTGKSLLLRDFLFHNR